MSKPSETHLQFALDLSRQAGQLLLNHYQRTGTPGRLKSDRSLVTDADLASDRLIGGEILHNFPNDRILSEESSTTLSGDATAPVWVIDPLDATTNFSLGLHIWGVLIARIVGGYTELAVSYFPLVDELYYAQRGQGAYLNDSPIQAHSLLAEQPVSFFSCCGRTHRQYQVSVRFKPRILGSAGYTYCCVARGAAILGFEATPKIWDLAGAWLIVQEAGGVIEPHAGLIPFPLQTGLDYSTQVYPTLAAATSEQVALGRAQIRPK